MFSQHFFLKNIFLKICERTQYKTYWRQNPQTVYAHHNTPTSTARVGALRPMPYCLGIGSTRVGPGRTPTVHPCWLRSGGRGWAQPRPRAHASDTRRDTRSANTKCAVHPDVTVEQGWWTPRRVATKQPGSGTSTPATWECANHRNMAVELCCRSTPTW